MNCIYDAVDKFSQIYWGILCRPVATVISNFMIFPPPFIQYNVQSCSYNLALRQWRKSAKQQSKILNSLKYPNFIWPKPSSPLGILSYFTWKPENLCWQNTFHVWLCWYISVFCSDTDVNHQPEVMWGGWRAWCCSEKPPLFHNLRLCTASCVYNGFSWSMWLT